ncbi:MAG: LCP family protein [Caldilineaceae bacterium]|nr:LCP family protein [Caldilineaceae bacterium]
MAHPTQRQQRETEIHKSESSSPKKRLLAVLLAAFYSVTVLTLALVAGNLLYEWTRSNFAAVPLITLDSSRDNPADSPAASPGGEEMPGVTSPTEQGVSDEAALPVPKSQVSILLLGTDERTEDREPPRTDTMLLLTLDLENRVAGMISLPRDLWVPIPGYDITTKINTAYVIGEKRNYPGGGSQLAKDTVSSFVGRPVEHYVHVNFSGFVRFIDLIDGIDIFVPQTIHDEQYPTADYGYQTFHLEAGQQHLDGEVALKYVRTRNIDSDYGRAARQQQVIQAVMDKVLQADMIPTLIAKLPQLSATMRDSVSTDMSLTAVVQIAQYVRQNSFREVRRLVLDDRYGTESYSDDGAWILLPDRSRIRPALVSFFEVTPQSVDAHVSVATGNEVLSTIAAQAADLNPSQERLVTDPAVARVEVLNGTGYPGVAARIRDMLQERGWQVVAIGDADRSDYRRTLIVNYNTDPLLVGRVGDELELQSNLPTLNGLILSKTVDLRIIAGQDFLKNVLDNTP